MTLNDLVKVYHDTYGAQPYSGAGHFDLGSRAGIRAVVEALRDELADQEADYGGHFSIVAAFNDILGKEAVPGGASCHSAEHAVPETTSKGEQDV